jgi:hypothetical protein
MVTRHQDNTRKIKSFSDHVTYLTTKHPLPPISDDYIEPTTFHQANKIPQWHAAMAQELNALLLNKPGFLFLHLLIITSLAVNGYTN